jgi:release factor glutamine methyltransferase
MVMAGGDAPCFAAETTRAEALVAMVAAFRATGVETPDRDARKLLAGVLGVDAVKLLTDPGERLGAGALAVEDAMRRRVAREPVSRILGYRDFYGHRFVIAPATLDPRADSECVVAAALEFLAELRAERRVRVLDIGTGSGCLLLSILAACPNAVGLGTDIDQKALDVAAQNAARLGLGNRVAWACGSGLAPATGVFDLIVSNPPYIRSDTIAGLDAEVRLYDPRGALDGGADGLDIYKQILEGLLPSLPNGWLLFEVGDDQADPVAELIQKQVGAADLAELRMFLDMAGVRRCVAARTQRAI